jgi:hypothetical protein
MSSCELQEEESDLGNFCVVSGKSTKRESIMGEKAKKVEENR